MVAANNGTNGSDNGRDTRGRFGANNKFGKGNPHCGKIRKLRSALLARVSKEDIRDIVEQLLALAKKGDMPAIREILDRCVGRADSYATLVEVFEFGKKLDQLMETVANLADKPPGATRTGYWNHQ